MLKWLPFHVSDLMHMQMKTKRERVKAVEVAVATYLLFKGSTPAERKELTAHDMEPLTGKTEAEVLATLFLKTITISAQEVSFHTPLKMQSS